jgi:hypothetical protein
MVPIIPATQEGEVQKVVVKDRLGKKLERSYHNK